jgi:thiamine-phosphate pyrophosphorylase
LAGSGARATLARAAARLNARSGRAGQLPPLVLMTDDLRLADPIRAARALPKASIVILRVRDAGRRETLAQQLKSIAAEREHFLLIAGDPELAARIGADGIHLSERRIGEALHWRARFPRFLITCAAHDARALVAAKCAGADAALLSPVFPTKSHEGAPALGALHFRILVRAARMPVYALGGVDARTALQLEGSGAIGIAAIGALSP